MARDDDPNACCVRLDVKLTEVVNCINEYIADLQQLGLTKLLGPRSAVIIATYRGDRRDAGELIQNGWIANIAGMDDSITALQECFCLRPDEPVRVGDEAYSEHRRAAPKSELKWIGLSRAV